MMTRSTATGAAGRAARRPHRRIDAGPTAAERVASAVAGGARPIMATAAAVALALVAVAPATPPVAMADAVDDAYEQVDIAQWQVDEAEASRDDVLDRIAETEARIDDVGARLPGARGAIWSYVRTAYKSQASNGWAFVDALLGSETADEALSVIRAHQALVDYGTWSVRELEATKAELEATKASLDEELSQAEMTLQEAHEELEARQEEADEAERAAAAAASTPASTEWSTSPSYDVEPSGATYTLSEFMWMGVIYQNGFRYTYYEESVLPGGGLSIPGRHHEDGFICDGDGYICVASNDFSYGTVVPVPFAGRMGKVYDCGCASGTIDIYIA